MKSEKSEKSILARQARRWQVTYNDWKEKEIDDNAYMEIVKAWENAVKAEGSRIRYVAVCYEVAPKTGHKHSHAYIELYTAKTGGGVQKILGGSPHLELCKGDQKSNIDYVKKHDVWSEFGTQCKKKDVEFGLVVDEIKNGADIKTLTEEHPELVIKNRKAVVDTISMFGAKSKHPLTDAEFAKRTPNPFQQGLIDHCEKMMSKYEDRKVIWIADPKGCTGKSSLVKFLKYKFGEENVIELGQGMTKDITYAWNGQRICVFDFSRTLEERINYNAIEAIKKGIVLSTKYESVEKWYDPPIVICFANFAPDESTMTKDVWDIRWNSPPNSGQLPFRMVDWPEIPLPGPQAPRFPLLVDDEKKE